MFRFLLSSSALCIIGLTPQLAAAEPKWQGHVEAEGKWGTERSLSELGLFLPVWQDNDTLVYGNIIGRLDDQNSSEGNFGLGLRQQIDNKWILGGYAFYDRRRTENDNVFHQATFGVEALSENMEFRVNGYLPEGEEKKISGSGGGTVTSASVVGGNFQLSTTTGGEQVERALLGVDIEAGYKFDIPGNWQLWAYGGGFHFEADGYDNVSGPRGRMELSYNDVPYLDEGSRFTVGYETQSDNVRGGQSWGIARLRIPLQAFSEKKDNARPALSELDKRMTARVQRDIDIVSAKGSAGPTTTTTEAATVTVNNQTYSSIADQIRAGDNIIADVAAAGANSLVVVDGANGTITTNQIAMSAGQTLIGGGSMLTATGLSGATAPLAMPGTRPLLNGTQGGFLGAVVLMGNNNTSVIGMDFIGTGGADTSVRALNASNIFVDDISFTQGGAGIVFTNSTGTARNFQIIDMTGTGILINSNSNMSIEDSLVDGVSTGINIQSAAASLSNIIITNTSSQGISVSANNGFTMSGVEISNTGSHAISVGNTTITAPGTGNTIAGTVGGANCNTFGVNTGSIAFDDIRGGGPGTCP